MRDGPGRFQRLEKCLVQRQEAGHPLAITAQHLRAIAPAPVKAQEAVEPDVEGPHVHPARRTRRPEEQGLGKIDMPIQGAQGQVQALGAHLAAGQLVACDQIAPQAVRTARRRRFGQHRKEDVVGPRTQLRGRLGRRPGGVRLGRLDPWQRQLVRNGMSSMDSSPH